MIERQKEAREIELAAAKATAAERARLEEQERWRTEQKAKQISIENPGSRQQGNSKDEEIKRHQAVTPELPKPVNIELGTPEILKRNKLIAKLENDWPSIKKNLNEASRNGLQDCKEKAGWHVQKCIDWAKTKGEFQPRDRAPLSVWPNRRVIRHE